MRINHNLMAMNTHRQLGINGTNTQKSIEKLSSGMRINKAGDDAAGLAISEKMRGQIRGLGQASRNAQDGISMIQTAEGSLSETQDILQRMRELAVQSSNETLAVTDREKIQSETDQLAKEVTRIANTTEFNTKNLLNGGLTKDTTNGTDLTFHIGANKGQSLSFGINAMDAQSLGVAASSTTGTVSGATDVTDATVTGSAAAVVDGNSVTVSTALVAGSAADEGTITATNDAAATTDLTGISANAVLTINVDGTDYTLNKAEMGAATGAGKAIADLVGAINTKLGANGTAAVDGSKIKITSATTGTSSNVSISMSGDTTTGIDTAFGFDMSEADTGAAAVADTYTVTMTDGTRTDSVITGLAGDEGSVSGTGDFAGVTLTTDGAFDENLAATVTLAVTSGSAATIDADGTVHEAVADAGINVSSASDANNAIDTINTAINTVSAERSKLGSYQNRLEHTIKNLDASSENLVAAESRIRDVDMAKEMMEFTKNNILQQAAQSMLAQANQQPQGVLQLLR